MEEAFRVLERDGSVGDIKERFLCQRIDRGNQCQGHIGCVRDKALKGDVGRFVTDKHRLVEVVPTIAVNVNSVVVITLCDGAVGEITLMVCRYFNEEFLSEIDVHKLDDLVRKQIGIVVFQGVLEDRSRHDHGQIVGRVNPDFNRVWQQHFFHVVELCNHVVGTGQQSSLVERSGFNHRS